MYSIKHKIMKNMTNEQKTLFLLKIPYINLFKLYKTYKQNINLIGFYIISIYIYIYTFFNAFVLLKN